MILNSHLADLTVPVIILGIVYSCEHTMVVVTACIHIPHKFEDSVMELSMLLNRSQFVFHRRLLTMSTAVSFFSAKCTTTWLRGEAWARRHHLVLSLSLDVDCAFPVPGLHS